MMIATTPRKSCCADRRQRHPTTERIARVRGSETLIPGDEETVIERGAVDPEDLAAANAVLLPRSSVNPQ